MSSNNLKLWYRQPATQWVEALPIGNGRVGAMVFGDVAHERLQLNEETLWSGGVREWNTPGAKAALPAVRQAIFDGHYTEADQLAKQLQGPFTQSYQPLGDLRLNFVHENGPIKDYYRELDLDTAIASVQYRVINTHFLRETFVSAPDQAIVVHLLCDRAGQLSFSATLDSQLRSTTIVDKDGLLLTGECPVHVEPSYRNVEPAVIYAASEKGRSEKSDSLRFATCVRMVTKGGKVTTKGQSIQVTGATQALLLVTTATSFTGFDPATGLTLDEVIQCVQAGASQSLRKAYPQLRAAHISDHQALFQRVELDLGITAAAVWEGVGGARLNGARQVLDGHLVAI